MLVTLVLGGLFAWGEFGNLKTLNDALLIPLLTGSLAIITFAVVLASYFVAPVQQLKASTYLNYVLITLTIALLVVETNGMRSPYLALLILTLPVASLLGLVGTFSAAVLYTGFIVYQYLVVGLAMGQTVQLSIIGGVALLAGALLWTRNEAKQGANDTAEDRSYHELASQLSQMSGKSDAVINAIGDGVISLNAKGVVQLINPAAERLIGWGSHDALNLSYKSVFKLLNAKNQPIEDINDPVAQVLTTNKPVKNDTLSIETQSGKSFISSISVSPVGKQGDGIIIVFRDITAEKSDERQGAEFISTASHEMRTPVASIEGYLGLVLNPKISTIDEKARDYVTKAHASAQHLGRLFADLLDVSKADDSRLKNDPKVVDVIPFVHDIVEGLTPKATDKGLSVIYKPIPDTERKVEISERRLTPVYYANVDNDHLREIVQNLVENAIKYTPKGDVSIDVGGDESHVLISITDTGIGIPREDQSHLFQKFYRVDNSDTREIGGTGLGLYLCRRLTETIGGRLWVESEYQHGSTFFVEIPRIGHDEATRLIEQASVEAERAAQAKSAKVEPIPGGTPLSQEEIEAEAIVAFGNPTDEAVAAPVESPKLPISPTAIPVTSAENTVATQSQVPAPILPGPGAMTDEPQPANPVTPTSIPTPTIIPVTTPVESATEPVGTGVVEPTPLTQLSQDISFNPQPLTSDNTPLSAIESDPRRYVAAKRAQPIQVTIPQR